MKISKIFNLLLAPMIMLALTSNCTDEEAITYSVKDVSERVSGYTSDVTGAGASLTITGTDLDRVVRIVFGNGVVPKKNFIEVTPTSLTFPVPSNAALGENPVFLVFSGNERAFAPEMTVIARPVIATLKPLTVVEGETIMILGNDLDIVTALSVAGTAAQITEKSKNKIVFTMPTGANSGKVALESAAGQVVSQQEITACGQEPDNDQCKPNLVLDGSFEEGEGDDFDNWHKRNGGQFMFATTADNEIYRGSRALKVVRDGTLGSGEWRIQFGSEPMDTELGASFSVSLWVRASVEGGSMRMSTQSDTWGGGEAIYQGNFDVPTEWTLITWEFTATEPTGLTRLLLDMNGNNTMATTFFIDDIRVIKN